MTKKDSNNTCFYYSNSTYASGSAHSMNAIQSSNAISELGWKVYLSGLRKTNDAEIATFYNVEEDLNYSLHEGKMNFARLYKSAFNDVRTIKNLKPSMVYGRSIFTAFMLSFTKQPFSFECHSVKWDRRGRLRYFYRRVFSANNLVKIGAISNALRLRILKDFPNLDEDQVFLARCGARQTTREFEEKGYVGYMGGFARGRGLELIVELAKLMPEIPFKLAGGNMDKLASIIGVKTNSLPPNLDCVGYVSGKAMKKFTAEASVLLAPYQKDTRTIGGQITVDYMSPTKIFEYMAAKRPILASDLPTIREVLDKQCACLLEADNVEQWTDAIRRMFQDKPLAKSMVERAHQRLINEFTWKQKAKNVIENCSGQV